nr:MAG TPA: hypothetical protein [Caudoviricetes sp.]
MRCCLRTIMEKYTSIKMANEYFVFQKLSKF